MKNNIWYLMPLLAGGAIGLLLVALSLLGAFEGEYDRLLATTNTFGMGKKQDRAARQQRHGVKKYLYGGGADVDRAALKVTSDSSTLLMTQKEGKKELLERMEEVIIVEKGATGRTMKAERLTHNIEEGVVTAENLELLLPGLDSRHRVVGRASRARWSLLRGLAGCELSDVVLTVGVTPNLKADENTIESQQ